MPLRLCKCVSVYLFRGTTGVSVDEKVGAQPQYTFSLPNASQKVGREFGHRDMIEVYA